MNYTTRKVGSIDKNYILLKHPLKPAGNMFLMGVKFCNGIAVVEKDSKVYRSITKSPLLRNRKEYGLEWLPKFGFRTKDVLMIFGKDIYYHYLKALKETKEIPISTISEPVLAPEEEITAPTPEEIQVEEPIEAAPQISVEEIIEAHKELGRCVLVKEDGTVCENSVSKGSPSGLYCFGHIRKDPEFKKE